jgi:NAD-dependent dihydropyrimidine dehydrogenase PreA subunit/flavodoxin
MNLKCIIIYESIYNENTLKLTKAMAQAIGCNYITASKALDMDLNEYQTIGLGSGIYFGKHHPKLFGVVEKLHSSRQDVFIFSSRGNPFLGKYHQPLKDALIEKGKNIIGEFSVRGYDETGPWVIIGGGHRGKPDEKDLKMAVRFAQKTLPQHCLPDYYLQIKNKLPIREGEPNTYAFGTNGSSVLLRGDRVTFNHSNCNGCGKCVGVCPLGIIRMDGKKALSENELDCTLCRLCVINCKQRAITLHYNWRDAIGVAQRHGKRTSLY